MSLKVEGHRKSYKKVDALKSLSFQLESGSSVALLGPNGAGKSTAIKILVSLLKPDGGSYHWNDEDLFARPARIRELMGYVSQDMAMDKQLTGAEFMRFCAGLVHLDWKTHKAKAYELLKTMGLEDAQDRLVGEYSGGMKRRLDLAAALLHDPAILILDEPTTGLDVEAREQIWGLIRQFMEKGGALILASHDFREVSELAEYILILQDGSVAAKGPAGELKNSVGRFIVRIKTAEFMSVEQKEAVKKALSSWQSVVWHEEEEFATMAYKGDEAMSQLQVKVCEALEAAGLHIASVNVSEPNLEDAYRFTLGGAK